MITYSDSGTGNYSRSFSYSTHINIINDAVTPLTFKVSGVTVTVLGMEQFEGAFTPFQSIDITATGPWRFVLEGDTAPDSGGAYYVAAVLTEVRVRINDVDSITYPDDELISYLNTTIDFLNGYLVNMKKSEMIKEMTIGSNTQVPADWNSFAGQYPVYITQDKFKTYDDNSVTIRYFALRPHVVTVADLVPFHLRYKSVLIQGTAMRALNRNEYDISQDKALLSELLEITGG